MQFATVNGVDCLSRDTTVCGLHVVLGPLAFRHRGVQGLAGLVLTFDDEPLLGAEACPWGDGDGSFGVGVSLLESVLLGVFDVPGAVRSARIATRRAFRLGSLVGVGVALPVFGVALLHGNLKGRVFVMSAQLVVEVIVQGHLYDVLFRVEDGVDAFVTFQRRVEERACAQREHADAEQGARGEQAAARAGTRASSGARGGGAAGERLHR